MLNVKIGGNSLYFLLFNFVIFSFLGWVMETVRVSLRSGKFVNRGFAEGPYCPIYGFGMVFIIAFLNELKDNIPLLFLCGMLLATTLEYITAWLLEIIFKAKWWDYSYKKYNLQGRICLDISIAWGFLSVVMIKLIVPLFAKLLNLIPPLIGQVAVVFALICISADVIKTGLSIISFQNLLFRLHAVKSEIKQEWSEFSEDIKDNFKEYMENADFGERLAELGLKGRELQERLSQRAQLIKELTMEDIKRRISVRDITDDELAFVNRIRDKYARYAAIYKLRLSRTHRRIMRAYPGFRVKNEEIQEVFKAIKDKINKND